MKRLFCILLILSSLSMKGQEKGLSRDSHMTFGIEWGYVATLHTGYNFNFFAPEGYRVRNKGDEFRFISNADVYANIGYDFNQKWNLSLYIGYEGIADYHKAVPVSVRVTRLFASGNSVDRWLAFADLGSGICIKDPVQEIFTGKLGGGYRLVLSDYASLDFIVSARFTHAHSQITYDKTVIPFDMINRNLAYSSAVSLGVALNF